MKTSLLIRTHDHTVQVNALTYALDRFATGTVLLLIHTNTEISINNRRLASLLSSLFTYNNQLYSAMTNNKDIFDTVNITEVAHTLFAKY
jgi:hypothetical protein